MSSQREKMCTQKMEIFEECQKHTLRSRMKRGESEGGDPGFDVLRGWRYALLIRRVLGLEPKRESVVRSIDILVLKDMTSR
jgi:hypothetical protein